MPSDVSEPRWRCDTCGTTYEGAAAYAQADTCETSPTPVPLPPGTPVLLPSSDLFDPATWARVGDATVYRDRYRAGPGGHCIRYARQDGGDRALGPNLWPNTAGALQLPSDSDRSKPDLGAWLPPSTPEAIPEQDTAGGLAEVFAATGAAAPDLEWAAYRLAHPIDPASPNRYDPLQAGFLRPDLDEDTYAAVLALCDSVRTHYGLWATPDDLPAAEQRSYAWRVSVWRRSPAAESRIHTGASGPHFMLTDGTYRAWTEALALRQADGDVPAAIWWLATSTYEARQALITAEVARFRAGDRAALIPVNLLRVSDGMTRGARRGLMRPEHKAAAKALGVDWASSSPREVVNTHIVSLAEAMSLIGATVTEPALDPAPFRGAHIAAVYSGKGGVGKTTAAAALAHHTAGAGRRVLLVDADVAGPSLGELYRLPAGLPVTGDGRVDPALVEDRMHVISLAQVVPADRPVTWRRSQFATWLRFLALRTAPDIDVVIIDMPPGQGMPYAAVHDVLNPATRILVTTASPLSLADARRAASTSGWRPTLVIESMSVWPDGTRLHGQQDDVPDLAGQYNAAYAGSLPWQSNPRALADAIPFGIIRAALDSNIAETELTTV